MNTAVLSPLSLRLLAALAALCIALGAGTTMLGLAETSGLSTDSTVLQQAEGDPEASPTPNISAPATNEGREDTLIALGVGSLVGMVLLGLGFGLYGYLSD